EAIGEVVSRADEPLCYKAIGNVTPIQINDVPISQTKHQFGIANALYVPLISRGKAIGVLKVSNKTHRRLFTRYDLEMLTILAGQAATAIENASLFDKIKVEKSRLSRLVKKVLQAQEEASQQELQ
ncbi:MAG: GAF domain-containing protein, partial [Thermoproteota archaeon]